MPQAAAHIIIPILVVSLIRDIIKRKNGKTFPLHYVLIVGISGIIPDLDVAAFWILHFFGFTFSEVHRTFAHTIYIPILVALAGVIIPNKKLKLSKSTLQIQFILYSVAIGILFHLAIDAIFQNKIMPFYPFYNYAIGLNLFGYLPYALRVIAAPSLDAGILIFYLIYLEWRHKISSFI